jgi:hypothetical protein
MTVPVKYKHLWIPAKVQGRKNKDFAAINPRDDLKAYLEAELQNANDVVARKVHHPHY